MTHVASSFSSPSGHAYPEIMDDTTNFDMTHLSGMTMADFIKEPQMNLIQPTPSASQRSSLRNSKRASTATASTTKSQLRQTNQVLIQMLGNIQQELAAHRTIMLDIQQRVSHLEYESNASASPSTPRAALNKLEGQGASRRSSRLVPPEGRTWWEACQNYARNAEPPMSAREFLRTPVRFSGFDLPFQVPLEPPAPSSPPSPPSVADLPPLTPTSDGEDDSDSDGSDVGTPSRHEIRLEDDDLITSTPTMQSPSADDSSDIREHTIEVFAKKMPTPPVLQPPPSGKGVLVEGNNTVTAMAIEPEIGTNSHRYFKGVKSLATYRALMKNKQTDKGRHPRSLICGVDADWYQSTTC